MRPVFFFFAVRFGARFGAALRFAAGGRFFGAARFVRFFFGAAGVLLVLQSFPSLKARRLLLICAAVSLRRFAMRDASSAFLSFSHAFSAVFEGRCMRRASHALELVRAHKTHVL